MTEEEFEDCRYQRVILLDPPPTAQSLTVTLADGSSFRPMELMVCPVCRNDYLLGTSQLLYTNYEGLERGVGVCPTCSDKPPKDFRRKLRVALGRYLWCEEGQDDSPEECTTKCDMEES